MYHCGAGAVTCNAGKSSHWFVDVMLQVEVVADSLDQVLSGQHVDLMKVVRVSESMQTE